MTVAALPSSQLTSLAQYQHLVLDGISWELYERLIREIGNRQIRMTFADGRLEIMSPLPEHEIWGARIGLFIELLCLEQGIPWVPLGSTTFRDASKAKGFEPDKSYYIQNAGAAARMRGAFDPAVNPPPDLSVEIDITRRSIDREPLYAALGVPELWRFDGRRLTVHSLQADGSYEKQTSSRAFPFLPLVEFEKFIRDLDDGDDLEVTRAFQRWVRTLKP